MDCPACAQPLVVVEREGIELDWCLSCRGLWFDEGELEILADKAGRRLEAEDIGVRSGAGRSETARICPRCGKRMEKAVVVGLEPVLVDRCPEHGIWLDRGELGRILGQLAEADGRDEAVVMRFLGETFGAAAAPPGEGSEGRGR